MGVMITGDDIRKRKPMTWEMYKKYEKPHKCDLNGARHSGTVSEGDIIRCTECDQLWVCYLIPAGGMQWDPYPAQLAFRKYTYLD